MRAELESRRQLRVRNDLLNPAAAARAAMEAEDARANALEAQYGSLEDNPTTEAASEMETAYDATTENERMVNNHAITAASTLETIDEATISNQDKSRGSKDMPIDLDSTSDHDEIPSFEDVPSEVMNMSVKQTEGSPGFSAVVAEHIPEMPHMTIFQDDSSIQFCGETENFSGLNIDISTNTTSNHFEAQEPDVSAYKKFFMDNAPTSTKEGLEKVNIKKHQLFHRFFYEPLKILHFPECKYASLNVTMDF